MAEEEKPERPAEGRKSKRESKDKDQGLVKRESKDKSRSSVGGPTKSVRSRLTITEPSMSRIKVRRQSYGFRHVAGTGPVDRSSQIAIEFRRPIMTYLNTYQLDPRSSFHIPKVKKIINKHLNEKFGDHRYHLQESPALAIRIAGEVMRELKQMQFNRYRIISVVTIGQKRAQSYNNAISFLWDHERDSYADVEKETCTAFIQVTVFAVYLD
ncbi:Tctex1 domain-containing protein 3 [Eumeta japonica]|uniref:Tctex1 domain-containing protein 3 n=1 Tax=Eumeta variegata TaxID=151549 RepID=A0A4C1V6M9_EUMVA|nr:Tctex1 domain-containing protein 3 [Eumeta japonica]